MKKVGLITLHDWHNCGSMLQTYALWKYMDSINGIECEVIDFMPEKLNPSHAYQLYDCDQALKNRYHEYIDDVRKRKECFSKFYSRIKKGNQRYCSDKAIECNPPKYDIYVSGSDQIWNVNFRIASKAYFLKFTDSEEKFAFSTSIGRCMERKLKNYADYMNEYKKIYIREESGAERVRNVTQRDDVETMIDPTLLFDKETWLQLVPKERLIKERYIVCYATIESQLDDMIPILQQLRDRYNLSVVLFGMVLPRDEDWIINKVDAGPYEFLRLFRDAEMVLTHSFHGTVFAINFHKNFMVFNDKTHNFRKTDILNKLGLMDRIVHSEKDVNRALESILDYEEVDLKLVALRKKACEDINSWIGTSL